MIKMLDFYDVNYQLELKAGLSCLQTFFILSEI